MENDDDLPAFERTDFGERLMNDEGIIPEDFDEPEIDFNYKWKIWG